MRAGCCTALCYAVLCCAVLRCAMLSNSACSHSPTHLPPFRLAITPQTYKTSVRHIVAPRLDEVGHGVGLRLLEVLAYRERGQRRETRLLDMLKFVHRWAHCMKHVQSLCKGSRSCAA